MAVRKTGGGAFRPARLNGSVRCMSNRLRLSYWYVVAPAVTMLLVWPPVSELPPLRITENFNVFQVLIALPFWVGLAAAPGYLYAWSGQYDRDRASWSVRLWVGASLIAAFAATVGGLISALAVIPLPFDIASIVCAGLMIRRFLLPCRERGHVLAT